MHPAAKWHPDDFDLPTEQSTQAPLEIAPQFLQPAHQPQMRLPSLTSSWFPLPGPVQMDRSATLTMLNGYNGYDHMASSSSLPVLPALEIPEPPSHLWTDHNASAAYTAVHGDGAIPSAVDTAFHNQWDDSAYAETWTNNDMILPLEGAFADEQPLHQDALDFACNTAEFQHVMTSSQDTGSCMGPKFVAQELPQADHTQLTYSMLPLPTRHNPFRESFQEDAAIQEQYSIALQAPLTPELQTPSDVKQADDVEETASNITTDHKRPAEGRYIHALCGKGFETRSKVKKHHWGKKNNDLATTTGCWAKHRKPDSAWDNHPSCKDARSASEVARSGPHISKRIKPETSASQPTASATLDVPQYNTISGFPTLEDLPLNVATTVNANITTPFSAQESYANHYHHRLSSRTSSDSVLTAVNVVSQIDAPKPQGRTDSIAMHLDAQVAATEGYSRHSRFVPFVPLTSCFDPRYRSSVASTAQQLTSPNIQLSSPANMSQPSVLPSEVEDSCAAEAFSQPFKFHGVRTPSPASKKRKV